MAVSLCPAGETKVTAVCPTGKEERMESCYVAMAPNPSWDLTRRPIRAIVRIAARRSCEVRPLETVYELDAPRSTVTVAMRLRFERLALPTTSCFRGSSPLPGSVLQR